MVTDDTCTIVVFALARHMYPQQYLKNIKGNLTYIANMFGIKMGVYVTLLSCIYFNSNLNFVSVCNLQF